LAQAKKDGENVNGERWSESWGERTAADGKALEKWTSKHAVDGTGKEPPPAGHDDGVAPSLDLSSERRRLARTEPSMAWGWAQRSHSRYR
jgi:hypothetical protein